MKHMRYLVLITIVFACVGGCGPRKAPGPSLTEVKVLDIVNQMPAEDSQRRDALAAGLVELNPKATVILAKRLAGPAEPHDTAARYGLSALTDYTRRSGAEAERSVYVSALIDALGLVPDKQNKAFLISQLQLAGGEEAAESLGVFLEDDFLCDYAVRALLTIGGEGAEAELLAALDSIPEANKVPVIKGLGVLRSKAAVDKIAGYAASQNPDLRDTALYALATIGDPSSQTILARAAQAKKPYRRSQSTALYLLYAQRQAEAGRPNRCARICQQVVQRNADHPALRSAAIQTLRSCLGDDTDKITNATLRQQVQALLADSAAGISAPQPPAGYISLFNGKDLTGWKRHTGLPGETEPTGKWTVEDGAIVGVQDPPGKGGFLTTTETFRDFELMLETKIDWPFDTGVFLRVGPAGKSHQVTLDYRDDGQIGSIYCPWTQGTVCPCPDGINHFKKDQWNQLRILCTGQPARIQVWLNGTQITDFQHTEETTAGIPEEGTLCLQVHPGGEGYDQGKARFRNIFIRRLEEIGPQNILTEQEKKEGFVSLFNGRDLAGWTGATDSYGVKEGILFCRKGTGRNIYTEKEYANFVLRFEFKLEPGANNGLGIRAPLKGDAAYLGMEIQILDDTAQKYSNLHDWQYHGSIYGIVPAKRGYLEPVGQWNQEEVIADGTHITVILNGTTIVDADIKEATRNGTLSGKEHPGLFNEKGHIGFLGHGDYVEFRTIRIKEL